MSVFDSFDLRGPGLWQGFMETFAARELECMQVEVTSACPGRCTYCPHTIESDSWKSRHMQPEVFAALWPLMRRTARVHLQGWGEPLLHPHFFDFVELAIRAGCRVSTTTCGLHMNDTVAEKLVVCGVDVVAFSLVGTDETSNAARAGVSFARVEAAVRTLQRVRKARVGVHLEVHLAYLLLWSVRKALRGLPALMDDWDVHGAVISTLDFIARPEFAAEAILPADTDKITEAAALIAHAQTAATRPIWAALPENSPAPQCKERVHKTLYVDAEGQVSPCIYLNVPGNSPRRRVVGNVLTTDACTLWADPDYTHFRERVGTTDPDPVCLDCPKRFSTN